MMMMMMMMMIWGSLRANEHYTDDDHEFWCTLVKCCTATTGGQNRYLQVDKSWYVFVVFSRKPISIRVRRGKKITFFQNKLFFFSPLVSGHVVTLNCFTVRAHFFDFPIDFFWSLSPSLYADEVLCAAFRAARTPPYSIRVRQNSQNDETQCKSVKRFF